jgi:hypothetical protein
LISLEDKINYEESHRLAESSNMLAIILLILGLAMFICLISYLMLSSKYVNKRMNLKFLKFGVERNNNVEIDGDYLISGMYL